MLTRWDVPPREGKPLPCLCRLAKVSRSPASAAVRGRASLGMPPEELLRAAAFNSAGGPFYRRLGPELGTLRESCRSHVNRLQRPSSDNGGLASRGRAQTSSREGLG
jgi:hypothetical protein